MNCGIMGYFFEHCSKVYEVKIEYNRSDTTQAYVWALGIIIYQAYQSLMLVNNR